MSLDFWHDLWQRDHIPFHRDTVNPNLTRFYQEATKRHAQGRVLLPLCGKSLDIIYWHQQGHHVTGVEISEKAIKNFFQEHALPYQEKELPIGQCFIHKNIEMYCVDLFEFPKLALAPFDLVYDRAALIALPEKLRARYASVITDLTHQDSQVFLITLDYPADTIEGPPYAVTDAEVEALYGQRFQIACLSEQAVDNVPEEIQGKTIERCYLLTVI